MPDSPPEPTTIRSLIEEIIDANTGPWIGQVANLRAWNRERAVAALALLDDLRAKRSNLPVAFAVQLIDPDPVGRPETSGSVSDDC